MSVPIQTDLIAHYPGYVAYTSPEVKVLIGGRVDADWITNTCAVRMSRGFNYTGYELPHGRDGLTVVSGTDEKWYAFRLRELVGWMIDELGPPSFDLRPGGRTTAPDEFARKPGIILFDIAFGDATGHVDLWDGDQFTSERAGLARNFWGRADRIRLWRGAAGPPSPPPVAGPTDPALN